MTATALRAGAAGAPPGAGPAASPWGERPSRQTVLYRDASTPLIVFLTLLFGLPAALVFPPMGAAGSPASMLGIVLFLWWCLARILPTLGAAFGRQPVRTALYLLLTTIMLSFLAGSLQPRSGEEASSSLRSLLAAAAWSGILLVTADGLRTRASLDRVLRWTVVGGVFLAALGLVQFFTGWNPASSLSVPGLRYNSAFNSDLARSSFTRVQGTATHAIEFGVVLAMVLPLAMHYAWFSTDRRRRRWAAVLLIVLVMPMTVSRSAMLGLLVDLGVLMAFWNARQRKAVLLVAPFVAVALKVMVPGLLGTLRGLFRNVSNDPSAQGREDDLTAVEHYVDMSRWFGRGIGTFIPEIYRTLDNAYFGWTIEVGFVGLAALVGLQLTGILTAVAARWATPEHDVRTRDLAGSVTASLIAGWVNFGTFDALGFAMFSGLFFLLLGSAGALWRLSTWGETVEQVPRVRAGRRFRWSRLAPFGIAAAAGAVVLQPGVVQTEYVARGATLLSVPYVNLNPYVYGLYLNSVSEVVQIAVNSPSARAAVRRAGHTGVYTLAAGDGSLAEYTDKIGHGPLILVQARASTAAQAEGTRDAALRSVSERFDAIQAAVDVPQRQRLRAEVMTADSRAVPQSGSRTRAVGTAAVLGYVLGVAALGGPGHRLGRRLVLRYILRQTRVAGSAPPGRTTTTEGPR